MHPCDSSEWVTIFKETYLSEGENFCKILLFIDDNISHFIYLEIYILCECLCCAVFRGKNEEHTESSGLPNHICDSYIIINSSQNVLYF